MNWRVQASLLFVVGALGATLWLTNETSSDQGSVSVSLLANHRIATAVRMQWQFADEEPIEVRRQPGGPFRIVHPIDDLLAQDHLVNLASTFDSAMVGETPFPDDEQNRARTGLDKPRLMLEIDFEDGAKEDIEIGSEGPLGSDLFVRRKGAIYRGGLALFTAMIMLGFYNGSYAGQAIHDARHSLHATRAPEGSGFRATVSVAWTQLVAFLINATKGAPAADMIGVPEFLGVITDLTAHTRDRFVMYVILLIFYTALVLAAIALLMAVETRFIHRVGRRA